MSHLRSRPAGWHGLLRACATTVLGALAITACSGPGPGPPPADSGLFDHLKVHETLRSFHPASSVGVPVSLVLTGNDTYLICDYNNVYRVARSGNVYTVATLAPPAGVSVWSPAGLDYREGRLYVANYLGRDVLELALDGDGLRLVRRTVDPRMVEPKHVHVEADGSMVVADHAGGAVLRFGPDGTVAWRAQLEQANGVTESGGFTYATSLSARTISKIDGSGRIVATAGAAGAAIGEYLLPVDVADLEDRIAVTDPVEGRITLLDHDLDVVGHQGGNGPGMDAFNYPFALLPVAGGYMIADSFKQRLLHVDGAWSIWEQIALGPAVPVGRQRPLVHGSSQHPSTYPMLPGVDIAAELGLRRPLGFVGAFGGLDHVGGGGTVTHLDLGDDDFGGTNAAWALKVDRYVVAGSAESHLLDVIDPRTGMFAYVEVGEDSWWYRGLLLTPYNLRRTLASVVKPALAAFDRAQRLLDQGESRQMVFQKVLAGTRTRDWAHNLVSSGGKTFAQSGMTRADAARYDAWALQQPSQSVTELLEVKFLTGP